MNLTKLISGPWGALGGEVVGALFGRNSAREAATTAFERSKEMNEWLGKNQIQWRVEDMKKAGLNPVMAASSGLSGIATQAAPMAHTPTGAGWGHSASGAAMNRVAMAQAQAQTALTVAQAQKTTAETEYLRSVQTPLGVSQAGSATASAGQAHAEAARIRRETEKITDQIELIREQTRGAIINNDTAERLQDLLVQLKNLEVRGAAAQLPRKEAEGKAGAAVGSGLDVVSDVAGAAGSYIGGKAADLREWIDSKLSEWRSNANKRRGK